MERFIHRENLALLRRKPAEAQAEAQRKVILKLLAEEEAKSAAGSAEIMKHRGVRFTVVQLAVALWKWQFEIDETVTTGMTKTKLMGMAVKRAQIRINRELHELERSRGNSRRPADNLSRVKEPPNQSE